MLMHLVLHGLPWLIVAAVKAMVPRDASAAISLNLLMLPNKL
jgi:hypothetical protein